MMIMMVMIIIIGVLLLVLVLVVAVVMVALDIWQRITIDETHCCHFMGYSF